MQFWKAGNLIETGQSWCLPKFTRQFRAQKPIIRGESKMDFPKPLQGHLMQAATHRIADHQCANQRRASYCRSKDHTKMRASVKAEAAEDERAEGHGRENWSFGIGLQCTISQLQDAPHPPGQIQRMGHHD